MKSTVCNKPNYIPAGLDGLLPRLDGVKQTGQGQYIARCPVLAHDDKSPSLSVTEAADRVLVHCFGDCDTADIVAAIGLDLADLFNEPMATPERRARAVAASRSALAEVDRLRDELVCSTSREAER